MSNFHSWCVNLATGRIAHASENSHSTFVSEPDSATVDTLSQHPAARQPFPAEVIFGLVLCVVVVLVFRWITRKL